MVVSSSLSQCIETANLVAPTTSRRVVHENFWEINGKLLNAKRRDKIELERLYPSWRFDNLKSNHDDSRTSWTSDQLESVDSYQTRGWNAFQWLTILPVDSVLLVCHEGILHSALKRENITDRNVNARFENCELREYHLSVHENSSNKLVSREEKWTLYWKLPKYEAIFASAVVRTAVLLTRLKNV